MIIHDKNHTTNNLQDVRAEICITKYKFLHKQIFDFIRFTYVLSYNILYYRTAIHSPKIFILFLLNFIKY